MLEEDYVSVEIAKTLKEKGFDWDCESKRFYPEPDYDQESPDGVYAPTLQTVRKWLREKHHLHIEVRITNHSMSDMVNIIKYYWVMCDTETGRWCDESTVYDIKPFDKSEEAEEDAIRIALKNWIRI